MALFQEFKGQQRELQEGEVAGGFYCSRQVYKLQQIGQFSTDDHLDPARRMNGRLWGTAGLVVGSPNRRPFPSLFNFSLLNLSRQ